MMAQRMYGLMYGHVRLIAEIPDNITQAADPLSTAASRPAVEDNLPVLVLHK